MYITSKFKNKNIKAKNKKKLSMERSIFLSELSTSKDFKLEQWRERFNK
jgi:hypothetical protein